MTTPTEPDHVARLRELIDEAVYRHGADPRFVSVRVIYSPGEPAKLDEYACSGVQLLALLDVVEAAQYMLESYEILTENSPAKNIPVMLGVIKGAFYGEPEKMRAALAKLEGGG